MAQLAAANYVLASFSQVTPGQSASHDVMHLCRQFVALCLVSAVWAAPQFRQNTSPVFVGQPEVRIISKNFDSDDSGNYQYSYEQDDGQRVSLNSAKRSVAQ